MSKKKKKKELSRNDRDVFDRLPLIPYTLFDNIEDEKTVDLLILRLLFDSEFQFLPELKYILGHKKLVEFLQMFSGTTIKVPNIKNLSKAVQDVVIYMDVQRNGGSVSTKIASKYDQSIEMLRRSYKRMETVLEKFKGVLDDEIEEY